ncbi:uncharacterized protein V2V93DRAFT_371995 [Kockiozyma suomiensis]|uniref:uncharacterized protein n=1 Tax=Kockiozyma suomiensis TaxID=1337062 RepID=UPI003343A60F
MSSTTFNESGSLDDDILVYARYHGIAFDHADYSRHLKVLDFQQFPIPDLSTSIWQSNEFFGDIMQNEESPCFSDTTSSAVAENSLLLDIESANNDNNPAACTDLIEQPDYVGLRTFSPFKRQRLIIQCFEEPLFERNDLPPKLYLERVSPYAYMGNMMSRTGCDNKLDNQNEIFLSKKKRKLDSMLIEERYQLKTESLQLLRQVASNTLTVDLPQVRHTWMSSPLLPASSDPTPYGTRPAAFLDDLKEIDSSYSEISISETFSTPPTFTKSDTPMSTNYQKFSTIPYLSSPLLISFSKPDDIVADLKKSANEELRQNPLTEAQPTEYSLSLAAERDTKLSSQMASQASKAKSILENEHLVEDEQNLRMPVPTVVKLESAADRKRRTTMNELSLKDLRQTVSEWRRILPKAGESYNSNLKLKWMPFFNNPKASVWKAIEVEVVEAEVSVQTSQPVNDPLALRDSFPVIFKRSHAQDWEMSDAEDMHDVGSVASATGIEEKALSSPRDEDGSLDSLIASHLAQRGRKDDVTDILSDTSVFKSLPLNPFELHHFQSSSSYGPIPKMSRADTSGFQAEPSVQNQNLELLSEGLLTEKRVNSLAGFKKIKYSPPVTIIFNTPFLQSNRAVYKDILSITENLRVIERDYGYDQPDILISSKCAIVYFDFPTILQREIDGTRSSVCHARRMSEKVETLIAVVQLMSLKVFQKSKNDWDALSDFMTKMAGIPVYLLSHEDDDSDHEALAWFTNIFRKFGGKGDGLAEVDTTVCKPIY